MLDCYIVVRGIYYIYLIRLYTYILIYLDNFTCLGYGAFSPGIP